MHSHAIHRRVFHSLVVCSLCIVFVTRPVFPPHVAHPAGQDASQADESAFVTIMEIQGATHTSPLRGARVTTRGIVTVVAANGFYLQDGVGDGNPETSDAVFVFTGGLPPVYAGDEVVVEGEVHEFLPGGDPHNLTTTEISRPQVEPSAEGNPVPEPVTIGVGGRFPPTAVIDNDRFTIFDPSEDGIDFYESLEGMRVRVQDPMAVSTTNGFGEFWVLCDRGQSATGQNIRDGITIDEGDLNPERIQIDDRLSSASSPRVQVGDVMADITGVMSYSFGNYEVLPSAPPEVEPAGLTRETTGVTNDHDGLTVASFNVLNLSAAHTRRIARLASVIVFNLRVPDILALQELQDNSGPVDDGTVDAGDVYRALVSSVEAAGGPTYDFREVAPIDGEDGGIEGGNIRVGLLYNPDRVRFIDRGYATAVQATRVVRRRSGPELTISPGRIDPTNPAWRGARKPLVGEFEFDEQRIFVVVNHFSSKRDSSPLFGSTQPPTNGGESVREAQAQVVGDFVAEILEIDARANVIVLGDFNELAFMPPLVLLEGYTVPALTNLTHTLPATDRYTFVFEGNSQALDHILVSPSLAAGALYDIVHVAAEFSDGVSDHDPVLARLTINKTARTPAAVILGQNAPNPFRMLTTIPYEMAHGARVRISIYDVSGGLVRTIVDGWREKGGHVVFWDGKDENGIPVSSGTYFCRARTIVGNDTRKLMVLK